MSLRTIACKPYAAVEGMRNVQRLLKTQNPRIGEVNASYFSLLYALKQSKARSQCLHLGFDIIGVSCMEGLSKGPFTAGSASEEGLHGY